jgi:hypothetical protein
MRWLAVCVLVAGFLAVWLGYAGEELMPEDCPGVREGDSYRYEPRWWPPGTGRCGVTRPDGRVVSSQIDVPWRDWATVVLFALAVFVLRPRPLRLLASLAVFVAGLAVWFIGPQPW